MDSTQDSIKASLHKENPNHNQFPSYENELSEIWQLYHDGSAEEAEK